MQRSNRLLATLAVCLLCLGAAWMSQSTAGESTHAFVGAAKCKMCHNSAAKGEQFNKWMESKHSKAYATLGSDAAKKIAAERGIGDPQKADDCLRCHVTGHGAPAEMLTDKYKVEDGVGCESCHGPGGDYWKMAVMKDRDQSIAAGMVLPTEATCKTCHNQDSPTYKDFVFAERAAAIAHPNPKTAASK